MNHRFDWGIPTVSNFFIIITLLHLHLHNNIYYSSFDKHHYRHVNQLETEVTFTLPSREIRGRYGEEGLDNIYEVITDLQLSLNV